MKVHAICPTDIFKSYILESQTHFRFFAATMARHESNSWKAYHRLCKENYGISATDLLSIYSLQGRSFTLLRAHWWRTFWYSKVRRKPMVYLWFVTEPDPNAAERQYGEPVLASAGRDADDSWRMLAANRQRMTGEAQDAEKLKREMTAKGYHVAKYQATPL